jgi:hypothetical protein
MRHLGYDDDQIAIIVAKPIAFVESVAQGNDQWRPSQLRRLAAAARVSTERLALLGIERSRLTASEREFVRDTDNLLRGFEATKPSRK